MLNPILPNTNGIALPYSGEISLVIRFTSSKNEYSFHILEVKIRSVVEY